MSALGYLDVEEQPQVQVQTTLSPPLALLHGRMGEGLLHLGVLTEAETYLCMALAELGEEVDLSRTWITPMSGGSETKSKTLRKSLFGSTLSVLTSAASSPLSSSSSSSSLTPFSLAELRKKQKLLLAHHVTSFQSLLAKIQTSVSKWSSIHVSGTHHKNVLYRKIFDSCRIRLSLAQVEHELNHPFRGLVILYECLTLAMTTGGPSPLLSKGLACLSALARSVLESEKLCTTAMNHAKTIAASSYSPPATAYLQRHEAMVELIRGDLDTAIIKSKSAGLILGDLNDVRGSEHVTLLIGDCYVLQGRPWPSLTEYAQVLDSARLRSDWRVQLSSLVGQAFVHFIGRDWISASAAVGLCESLVTDIVAALDRYVVLDICIVFLTSTM